MTAFLAIVKLTCKAAVRSHVFQLLLAILMATIVILPLTLVGDGTAHSYIQISLQYCLGAVSFLLSLSTIWLGCFIMGTDIESYQLHMVITKPISRVNVWLGKCTGIIIINTILLIISSLVVYCFIILQFYYPGFISILKLPAWWLCIASAGVSLAIFFFNFILKKEAIFKISFILIILAGFFLVVHYLIPKENSKKQQFTEKEKERITNEVLVGRRVYMPDTPDTEKITEKIFQRYLEDLKKRDMPFPENLKNNLKFEINKRVVASIGEVFPGQTYMWQYSGIDKDYKYPMYLRYRVWVDKINTKKQRETMGIWGARVFIKIPVKSMKKSNKKKSYQTRAVFSPRTRYPENIMCGIFNEIKMGTGAIDPNGRVVIGFNNFDPQGKKLYFQKADGPKLMIKVTGFFENYIRAILLIFARIVALAGISCAIGGVVSIPVAIFTVISYILFGGFSSYLLGEKERMEAQSGPIGSSALADLIGNNVSQALMLIVIPLKDFEVSSLLADGELIEISYMGKVIFLSLFFKCLVVVAIGIWFYRRKEMGLVVRK